MAVNLATKNAQAIASTFAANAYIASKCGDYFDFTGVKGVKIYTPITVALTDYTREGSNRYGIPQEMQDTVQELVMRQDKGFALTIDRGNNEEQMGSKNAGKMLNLQIAERVVPEVDKYALKVFLKDAGSILTVAAKPTKHIIIEEIGRASQALDDAMVPVSDRFLAVTSEMYSLLRLAPEFVGKEGMGTQTLAKGVVGELFGAQIIKLPTSYLPADCYFVLWHKSSVLVPSKLSDAKVHTDPPGISGDLLEGRWLFDAFVVGARAQGVAALVKAEKRLAAPEITFAANAVTVSAAGERILVTTDGTDPRYSDSAVVYSTALSTVGFAKGDYVVKAVAYAEGSFTSPVAEKTITVA